VRITGMTWEEDLPPEVAKRAYYAQPVWKRVVTILAGPAVNLLAAFLLFALVFAIGVPTVTGTTSRVAQVEGRSPAAAIGLRPGDRLVSVNGVPASRGVESVRKVLQAHPNQVVTVRYAGPGGAVVTRKVRLSHFADGTGRLGFSFETQVANVSSGFPGAVVDAGRYTKYLIDENVRGIGRLFTSAKARSETSTIVGVGAVYNDVSEQGFVTVLRFVGFVSLVLAIFNLLPLLPLDGGHILFALIEKVKGSPMRREAYERASFVGFALLMVVFIFALQNDIGRLTGAGFQVR
jgi:regulator of sigma E protease